LFYFFTPSKEAFISAPLFDHGKVDDYKASSFFTGTLEDLSYSEDELLEAPNKNYKFI